MTGPVSPRRADLLPGDALPGDGVGAVPVPAVGELSPARHGEALEVLRTGFGTEVAEFGITAENTPSNPAFWGADRVSDLVERGFTLLGVDHAGRLAGCAFVGASRGRPGTWVLRHLAVLPGARHRGIGAALVTEAARLARAGGAQAVRIGIVAENSRLSSWYRRLGFVPTESGVRYPGLVFTVDHLELPLADMST